ncbi:F0F1 ATP synthase subunit epsilon [Dissulfurirhabdus thermomarina]|uniref:F0F1 ATP synthase subunit epsilon n=2 Tax=Dissulfurirhabdus thermomarina TaxID=1765737 RepID=A0A6N9TPF2_DISTH|nr:F0F1 ATP synthase subunit epsilon [Dissulfurirhabdus thermomarina]NMX23343.1 F0F1 ATP synthase subunit epsilon [Dissulfurirhabdus thermomarina]
MRLLLLLPTGVLLDRGVRKVVAEGAGGAFCLLPRHVDFVSALVPGILAYVPGGEDTAERFVAVDEGILVKCGREVRVSTRNAVAGPDLAGLRAAVERRLRRLDERERAARGALARLETGVVRRFMDLGRRL